MGWAKFRAKLLGAGGARIGGASNYVDFSTAGRQTMAGTARVRKEQYIDAETMYVYDSGCSGSMSSASMTVAITGSAMVDVGSGSMVTVRYITPAAKVTGASTTGGFFKVAKPLDADTTGSLQLWLDWTPGATVPATAGSTVMFVAAMAYFASGCGIRTAASAGACPAVSNLAANNWFSSSFGNLPSWGANDTWGVLYIGACYDGGTYGGSQLKIAGARLRYTACSLGVASTE